MIPKYECAFVRAANALADIPDQLQSWLDNSDPQTDDAMIAWEFVGELAGKIDKLNKAYDHILNEIVAEIPCDGDCDHCEKEVE